MHRRAAITLAAALGLSTALLPLAASAQTIESPQSPEITIPVPVSPDNTPLSNEQVIQIQQDETRIAKTQADAANQAAINAQVAANAGLTVGAPVAPQVVAPTGLGPAAGLSPAPAISVDQSVTPDNTTFVAPDQSVNDPNALVAPGQIQEGDYPGEDY